MKSGTPRSLLLTLLAAWVLWANNSSVKARMEEWNTWGTFETKAACDARLRTMVARLHNFYRTLEAEGRLTRVLYFPDGAEVAPRFSPDEATSYQCLPDSVLPRQR